MVLVHYWITSSKSWIDLVDFFDNHDVTFSSLVYFMLDGALKRKEGQYFGDIDQKNILMSIAIKSEDLFQKLISEKVLNPEYFITHDEIEPDEFSENAAVSFKNGLFFETDYELFEHLKEISFKFQDGSVPLTPYLLKYWYVPIHSNSMYKNIKPLYENKNLIFDMDYVIIDKEITCKDGRVLGKKKQITVCFEFISKYYRRPFLKLFEEGVLKEEQVFRAIDFNKEHLKIDYGHWTFKKSLQRFRKEEKMAEYLEEIDFKFEDNTIFKP
ncbi:MAG: hypothetical protein ACFFG0_20530 [Candidatus Thorarchaeota archaeon]